MPMDSAIAVSRDNQPAQPAAEIRGLAVRRGVEPILFRGCRNLNRRELAAAVKLRTVEAEGSTVLYTILCAVDDPHSVL